MIEVMHEFKLDLLKGVSSVSDRMYFQVATKDETALLLAVDYGILPWGTKQKLAVVHLMLRFAELGPRAFTTFEARPANGPLTKEKTGRYLERVDVPICLYGPVVYCDLKMSEGGVVAKMYNWLAASLALEAVTLDLTLEQFTGMIDALKENKIDDDPVEFKIPHLVGQKPAPKPEVKKGHKGEDGFIEHDDGEDEDE